MTTQQRNALNKANRVRTFRADFKRGLREQDREAGTLVAREVIGDPAPELAAMTVESLLRAVTRIGHNKARAYCRLSHVLPTRRLGDLTDHERLRLDVVLR